MNGRRQYLARFDTGNSVDRMKWEKKKKKTITFTGSSWFCNIKLFPFVKCPHRNRKEIQSIADIELISILKPQKLSVYFKPV